MLQPASKLSLLERPHEACDHHCLWPFRPTSRSSDPLARLGSPRALTATLGGRDPGPCSELASSPIRTVSSGRRPRRSFTVATISFTVATSATRASSKNLPLSLRSRQYAETTTSAPGLSVFTNVRVVVSGHSHKPLVTQRQGVLFVNPGSAGPRRFKLPVSVAELIIASNGSVSARTVELRVHNAT